MKGKNGNVVGVKIGIVTTDLHYFFFGEAHECVKVTNLANYKHVADTHTQLSPSLSE